MRTLHADTLRHSALLVLRNLPKGIDEAAVCDWLWSRVGLLVQEDEVSCQPVTNGDTSHALIAVTRGALADFLNRAVENAFLEDRRVHIAASEDVKRPHESWAEFASECTALER